MGSLAAGFVQFRHLNRLATGCRDAEKGTVRGWRVENHSVAIPGASTSSGRISQCLGRSAKDIDLLQFAAAKKTDISAVCRPERIGCAFRPLRDDAGHTFDRAHPQFTDSLLSDLSHK